MDISISNRDVDLKTPFQFIEGADIEISALEDGRNLVLQHTQEHDLEYWNLRWSASSRDMNSKYGINSDPEFEDALYSSLRVLDLDDSLSENINLLADDGESNAAYHCGMENVYNGMSFQISAGEMLKRISSKGPQSEINHGEVDYFKLMTEDREFIWENGLDENHYGILGTTPINGTDLYLLDSSLTAEERNKIALDELKKELDKETNRYEQPPE